MIILRDVLACNLFIHIKTVVSSQSDSKGLWSLCTYRPGCCCICSWLYYQEGWRCPWSCPCRLCIPAPPAETQHTSTRAHMLKTQEKRNFKASPFLFIQPKTYWNYHLTFKNRKICFLKIKTLDLRQKTVLCFNSLLASTKHIFVRNIIH